MDLLRLLFLATMSLSLVSSIAGGPIISGYYPSWKRTKMYGVDFSRYTHIYIAFALPKEDGTFTFEDDWAMPQVLAPLRAAKVKAILSVGGWTGSNHFSNILKSESKRSTLLNSMVDYVKNNNLDGIDIDWEYPGRLGNTCNAYDASVDAANYLAYVKDLRRMFDEAFGPREKLITLAVRVQPFDGPAGPLTNVSEFARYVDYANLMQYDINGGWNSMTGPNAPFNYEPLKGASLSFVSAIDAWVKAGWPASQLTAGIGFYGRSTTTLEDMTKDPANQYQSQLKLVPLGDVEDAPWYDACAQSTSNSGTWQWKNLRRQGVLANATAASAPWVRQWDSVSQTPWLFNPATKMFLSYDDPESIKVKAEYAASRGLAGFMVWSVNMDHNGELLNAASSAFSSNGSSGSSAESTPPQAGASTTDTIPQPPRGSGGSTSSAASSSSEASLSTSELSPSTVTTPAGAGNQPPSPLSTAGSESMPGNPCIESGAYRCIDSGGRNSAFLTCSEGKWVPKSCAPGTVCLDFGGSIVCGWPRLKRVIQGFNAVMPK